MIMTQSRMTSGGGREIGRPHALDVQLSHCDDAMAAYQLLCEHALDEDVIRRLAEQDPALAAALLILAIEGQRAASAEAETARAALRGTEPRKPESDDNCVLIAKEDPKLRLAMAGFLRQAGYQVRQAANGIEALMCFDKGMPVAVISDIFLPGMNGFKLMLEVKNRAPGLPILLITGGNSAGRAFDTTRHPNVVVLTRHTRMSDLTQCIHSMQGAAR